ncbi:DNA methyltransferase [Providencia rettgeri]|uniref:DNA-methyltransferase n=4 Tax=Providencia TaxID=586 RepID=UPI0032D9DEBA
MGDIYLGDCFDVMKNIEPSSVDLIYLDPPFFTGKKHKLKNKDRTKEYEFEDSWGGMLEYKNFLFDRIKLMHSLLKDTGSIFVHCDENAQHIIRFVLDDVFGNDNFQSEIIWNYKRWSNSKKGLLSCHQNIYFYSKTTGFKFKKKYIEYSETTNIDQILQKRKRDSDNKSVYALDCDGKTINNGEKKGVPLGDVWDIPYLNPKAKERTGYPTQKPLLLLDRIIELTTDEGDLVLDPFCGSGTTCVSALLSNRNYIGIDISKDAVDITKNRLVNPVKTESSVLKKGRGSYLKSDMEILQCLAGVEYNIIHRNKGIDAILLNNFKEKPVLVKIQKNNEKLEESIDLLSKAMKIKQSERSILIQTKDEYCSFDIENIVIIKSPELTIKDALKS